MKPRNPFATNLRHHKPKRIEDKREVSAKEAVERALRRYPNIIARLAEDD